MMEIDGIVLVRHSITGGVTSAEAVAALPEALQKLVRADLEFALDGWPPDSSAVDWGLAKAQQETWFDDKIAPLLRRSPGHALAYFGLAPIPLAFHLGYLVPSATRVFVFQHHHARHDWRWPDGDSGDAPLVQPDLPREPIDVRGDARLLLSLSYPVLAADTVGILPDPIAALEYRVDPLALDALKSPGELDTVARAVVSGMEAIAAARRNVESIHFFAAAPVGLVFRIGTLANRTVLPQIVTYQYQRTHPDRYLRAIDLGRQQGEISLSEAQKRTAGEIRKLWTEELKALAHDAGRSEREQAGEPWYRGLPGTDHLHGTPWSKLGALHESPLENSSMSERTAERDGFRFDPAACQWVFDDGLLAAIASRVRGIADQRKAGRLFLLHEALHHHCQQLDGSTGSRVGVEHPSIVEELDYRADVWAILMEFRLRGPVGRPEGLRWLVQSIDTHLDVAWSFVSAAEAASRVEVRRARRFLIWHWQREILVRLLERPRASAVADAIATLFTKPEVSISGPHVYSEGYRTFFRLDRALTAPVEMACVTADQRLKRAGASHGLPIGDVFDGFRTGDRAKVENAVRAFQRFAEVKV